MHQVLLITKGGGTLSFSSWTSASARFLALAAATSATAGTAAGTAAGTGPRDGAARQRLPDALQLVVQQELGALRH